jgi:tripartite-type tricarboxylate transporter receptor subunit TctC
LSGLDPAAISRAKIEDRERNVRRLTKAAICGVIAFLYCAPMQAADWPARPVTVIVPFAAGGNTDTVARILAQYLGEKLGQPFLIDNRGGASGAIAAEAVARAAPDGYTLLFGASPQISVVPRMQKVNYDPAKDFIPTSIVGIGTFVLSVNSELPAKTTSEFIAYAKERPGKLSYGSGGNATISRLAAALFVSRAGLKLVHVPYRGGGPAMIDFLAHHFEMYFGSALEVVSLKADSRIRLLGISSERRSPQFPDVPPIADVLPGFKMSTWNGLMAPAGTPPDIIDRLTQTSIAAAHDPAIAAKLESFNIEPRGSTQAEFADTIREEQPIIDAAIKAAEITSD